MDFDELLEELSTATSGENLDTIDRILASVRLAPGASTVADVMREPIFLLGDDDAKRAARRCFDLRLLAMPVVDTEHRVIGILTVDDTAQIMTEAQERGRGPGRGKRAAAPAVPVHTHSLDRPLPDCVVARAGCIGGTHRAGAERRRRRAPAGGPGRG